MKSLRPSTRAVRPVTQHVEPRVGAPREHGRQRAQHPVQPLVAPQPAHERERGSLRIRGHRVRAIALVVEPAGDDLDANPEVANRPEGFLTDQPKRGEEGDFVCGRDRFEQLDLVNLASGPLGVGEG